MASEEAFHPLSVRTLALALGGLITALGPLAFPGSHPVSALAHGALGLAMLGLGLWRVWRPLVTASGGMLHYRPRFASGRALDLPLDEVAQVLPTPPTGHAPSERDLRSWLGLRLRSGEFRWLDLAELRPRARARVRAIVAAAAQPRSGRAAAGA